MLTVSFFLFYVLAIIIILVLGVFYGIAAALLGASALLFGISFQENIQNYLLLRIISGVLFTISIYLFIEALRLGYWKDHYYHPSDDTVTKSPPNLLIINFIKWLKPHNQH